MNVFISWSGKVSKAYALAVNNWLKQAMHKVKPWMSDAEIGPGERWNEKVSSSLKETNFGIICVTSENINAPWILFEAGALAKALNSARVVPLLFGVSNTDLASPLTQFQAVSADKEGFLKLAAALNEELKIKGEELDESILRSLLRKLWPELDRELKRIVSTAGRRTTQLPRTDHDLLSDVLEGVRRLERGAVSDSTAIPSSESEAANWQDYYIRGANLANNLGDPLADIGALRAYSEAIVLAPRDLSPNLRARLYAHRGAILKRLKRLDEAENDISFALARASEQADLNDATYHMSSIKAMNGDRKAAFALLEELVARDGRWLDLVRAREEYFPGLLNDVRFKNLVRSCHKVGKGAKTGRPRTNVKNERKAKLRVTLEEEPTGKQPGGNILTKREPVTIACFNKATTPISQWGVDLDALIAAMQVYVDDHVAPVWGTPAKLIKSRDFVKNAWALIFLDSADNAGAHSYHDLTPDGLPQGKIFVRTTIDSGRSLSGSASHELVEMLVDPAMNRMADGLDSRIQYAYEVADPVEELSFPLNGLKMSDFVYPAYFENFRKPNSVQFDHLKKIRKPFEILPGGSQLIFKNGRWTHIFGSAAKNKRSQKEDLRGQRSERRAYSGSFSRANSVSF
jgi:tetratricopeptide (TPR) repeat protein